MELTKSRSTGITYLRVISTISIVVCHMLGYYENRWGQLFNTGVQVFFVISGILYGTKEITAWGGYFKIRFLKIYLPFLLFIFIAFAIYGLFYPQMLSFKVILCYILCLNGLVGIRGLGHLWFVPAIMICYLTLPILQIIKKRWKRCNNTIMIISSLLALYIDISYAGSHFYYVFLFASAYFWMGLSRYNYHSFGILILCLLGLVILKDGSMILDYCGHPNVWGYFHCLAGLATCYFFMEFFSILKICRLNDFVRDIANYSYFIYLVHGIFILGPFSLMNITPRLFLNIFIIILIIILSSVMLKVINKSILNVFGKIK